MSKVVLFSNIKGGVGKTTLCAHFSEYLNEKGMSVSAADADIQASLTRHREREIEADPEHAVSWEIVKLNTLDAGKLKADMKKLRQKDGIVVIDCPGNLNDNNLAIIYCSCPTASTLRKARRMRRRCAKRPFPFLANSVLSLRESSRA